AGARMPRADLARGADPLVGLRRRHADVDDRDVGRVAPHLEQELLGVPRPADDLDPRLLEQAREPLAQQGRVVRDDGAQRLRHRTGSSARTTVPRPGELATSSVPSSASTRSRRPQRPEPPRGSAPPAPSSETRTVARPSARVTRTTAERASACLTTFASASETT